MKGGRVGCSVVLFGPIGWVFFFPTTEEEVLLDFERTRTSACFKMISIRVPPGAAVREFFPLYSYPDSSTRTGSAEAKVRCQSAARAGGGGRE